MQVDLVSSSAASRVQASARRAVDRRALMVAKISSALWREEARRAAQVWSSAPSAKDRSHSRRLSGALMTNACRAEIARVR